MTAHWASPDTPSRDKIHRNVKRPPLSGLLKDISEFTLVPTAITLQLHTFLRNEEQSCLQSFGQGHFDLLTAGATDGTKDHYISSSSHCKREPRLPWQSHTSWGVLDSPVSESLLNPVSFRRHLVFVSQKSSASTSAVFLHLCSWAWTQHAASACCSQQVFTSRAA